MWARPSDGGGGGVNAFGEAARGVDHNPGRGLPGRTEKVGMPGEAGTSCSRRRGAGFRGDGGSISESD